MLILTRRVGEKLLIGDNIAITVVKRKGNAIQIGVDAPKDIPILREELSPHSKSQIKNTHPEE